MKQFNLSEWLQDKSRKVVTRRGNPVRIVCWDKKDSEYPIVGLVYNENGLKEKEGCCSFSTKGRAWGGANYDLFFADEEGVLTEFEKEVAEAYEWAKTTEREDFVKEFSPKLLDFARKELKKEFKDEEYFRLITEHYKQGKKEALKDLPKWKKCVGSTGPFIDYNSKDEAFLYLNDYVIKVSELEKLPKEE